MTISANFSLTRPSLLLDFSNQTVLDPRVTFARTTTALYYDNKSAALAEQNLLTYSNTFTNAAWVKTGIDAPVVGATDPAGGATGYTLTASAGSSLHRVNNASATISPATYTASVYLQAGAGAGSYTFATLVIGAATNSATATFNLSGAGSVTQSFTTGWTVVGSSITQVGSTAWYRCTLTATLTATESIGTTVQMNSVGTYTPTFGLQPSWTAAGTETLLVYGAQLEQRSSPTVYTATTATAVNTYTPTLQVAAINAPRFDYNPTTRESLGLLLEQASTNNQLYSSNFDNAAWTKTQTSITTAIDISPDGTQNAQLMTLSTTSAAHTLVSANFATYVASTTYTVSIYAKAYGSTSRYITFGVTRGSNDLIGALCNFDLVGGTAGTALIGSSSSYIASATSNIQPVGNGWYRCSVTYTTSSSGSYIINMYVVASNTATTSITFPSFAGNGFDGYLIWGAQYEAAPSATSYIANTAGTATVRTVDSASMTGTNFTSWYNYSGGTVYVEAASGNPTTVISPTSVWFTDGSTANQIGVYLSTSGVSTYAKVNNVTVQTLNVSLPSASVANTFYKTAWYYSAAGNGVSSVGQTATTYATAIVAPAITTLNLGSQAGSSLINGRIKKFAYYPAVLTNTQIQSLSAN
jgi:hypothetical protein